MNINSKNMNTLPNGIYSVERGVYLRVQGGSRYFIFKYQKNGKRREIGLGGTNQTIEGVRGKAAKLRAMLADGIDPKERVDAKKAERKAELAKEEAKRIPTFSEFYPSAIDHVAKLRQWRGAKTEAFWRASVRRHIEPILGRMPLDQITPEAVAEALESVWETASGERIQTYLSVIFALAISRGFCKSNPALWRGVLDAQLPSRAVLKRGKEQPHRAAVSPEELSCITKSLLEADRIAPLCCAFGILTVCRSAEFRQAKWSEIDFEKATLTVPPERRKDKRPEPFVVPLPTQAMELLKRIPRCGEYVFSANGNGPLSSGALLEAIKLRSSSKISVHGTRSTFSDWCAANDKNLLVSEKCLMHAVGGSVFMAYQRDDLLEKRRKLLQEWADFLLP